MLLRIQKINSPWGVPKISSMIKYKNSHPQTPIKITSTHLFYSKSALIFYWHPKTLLIPQPVDWIKLMVKFPFGFHAIHMYCDYQRDWLHPVHCTPDESDMKYCYPPMKPHFNREVVFCERWKSLRRESCAIAWGYGHTKFMENSKYRTTVQDKRYCLNS